MMTTQRIYAWPKTVQQIKHVPPIAFTSEQIEALNGVHCDTLEISILPCDKQAQCTDVEVF